MFVHSVSTAQVYKLIPCWRPASVNDLVTMEQQNVFILLLIGVVIDGALIFAGE